MDISEEVRTLRKDVDSLNFCLSQLQRLITYTTNQSVSRPLCPECDARKVVLISMTIEKYNQCFTGWNDDSNSLCLYHRDGDSGKISDTDRLFDLMCISCGHKWKGRYHPSSSDGIINTWTVEKVQMPTADDTIPSSSSATSTTTTTTTTPSSSDTSTTTTPAVS